MEGIKIGNAIGYIHSPLMELTEVERKEWFERELASGNPVLKNIERAVQNCFKHRKQE